MHKKIYLSVILGILFFVSCKDKKQYYEESGTVFHTLYTIKYEAPHILTDKIDAELQKFNLSLNPFNPNSIIAKVNNNEAVEVDEWFTEVFNKSMEVSRNSDGVFDITCAPLVNLWGFGFNKKDSVTPAMIDSLKTFVGYRKVHLEGKKVVKDDPRLLLNCSAIAKGYSCDVIARLLEKEGVENYMILIGGEVVVKGVNQNGVCWRYRNFYIKDGKKYAHTIDPRTGYPAEQSVLSATIVANDCMTADAYATAFMAMGLEKARQMADSLPEIEYYVIYADENGKHQIEYSKGMLQYLPKRKQ